MQRRGAHLAYRLMLARATLKGPKGVFRGCAPEEVVQLYSCFISYADEDQGLAERLHADLQKNGVRCWLAPEDMKIGDKISDVLDRTIRVHDKLLLILSEHAIMSEWVEDEVTKRIGKSKTF